MGPIVSFVLLLLAHLASHILALWLRTKRKVSPAEQQLAADIKDLLRQANSLITPSTFAKAAKLKRLAAAKERELTQLRKNHGKEQDWPIFWQLLNSNALQMLMYFILAYSHWGYPLLAIPSRSIYPFDGTISWRIFTFEDRNLPVAGCLFKSVRIPCKESYSLESFDVSHLMNMFSLFVIKATASFTF